jgi:hypothetical protein
MQTIFSISKRKFYYLVKLDKNRKFKNREKGKEGGGHWKFTMAV